MTSTRPRESRGRQQAGRAAEHGQVIRFPVTGQVVLFVSDSTGSAAMAAAFFELKAGPLARTRCATTSSPQPLSPGEVAVMAEVGMDLARHDLEELNDSMVRAVHHVVVLGASTHFHGAVGARADVERWPLDEPSRRGIDGLDRLRLIRDGIEARVNVLVAHLGLDASSR